MGANAQYVKQPAGSDIFIGGARTVTTAATRVQLSTTSVPCIDLIIQAAFGTTGRIYIGGPAVSSTAGIYLTAGQSLPISTDNLNKVWLDSTVNAEGVTFLYTATVG